MKTTLILLAFLFTVATAAHAQVAPEASAGAAELNYSAQYAQSVDFYGGGLGSSQNSTLSGSVDYANGFKRRPFSLAFSGGYRWTLAGTSYGNGLFENFSLSQGLVGRRWTFSVGDNIGYWKEAPVTGYSGVPGTGEPITGPNPTPPSSQTILTLNTRSIANIVNGDFGYTLNAATALNVVGSSELLRYPDGNGLDTSALTGSAGLTQRLDARNSLSGQYSFSDYSYPGNNLTVPVSSFISNSALFGYQRLWNRQITTNVSAGPEWTSGSNSAVVPSSTRISGTAMFSDELQFGSINFNYSHSASGGGGYLVGSEADSLTAGFSREFERQLSISLTGGDMRNSGLANQGVVNNKYGAAMASLRLGRYFTTFASYTAIDQSTGVSLPSNALTGLWQVLSFGVGYSPREKRVNSQ